MGEASYIAVPEEVIAANQCGKKSFQREAAAGAIALVYGSCSIVAYVEFQVEFVFDHFMHAPAAASPPVTNKACQGSAGATSCSCKQGRQAPSWMDAGKAHCDLKSCKAGKARECRFQQTDVYDRKDSSILSSLHGYQLLCTFDLTLFPPYLLQF